jgi:hypothetical protein
MTHIIFPDTAPDADYVAVAAQTIFDIDFPFFSGATDIDVYRLPAGSTTWVLLTYNSQYSVTGTVGYESGYPGGYITLVTPATADDRIAIRRSVGLQRLTDFPTSGPFQVRTLNTELDRLTAADQDLAGLLGRTVRAPIFDSGPLGALPDASARAGRALVFDGDGAVSVGTIAEVAGTLMAMERVGTGAQTTWTLPVSVAGGSRSVIVAIDGVVQPVTSYSVSEFTLTFGEAPPLNSAVDVRVIGAALSVPFQVGDTTAGFFTWSRTGDGATLTFSIIGAPLSLSDGYAVAINGISQEPTASFTVDSAAGTITFSEAPPLSSRIVITCLGFPRPITEYTAPFTGAISRTLQGRLGETISVKDFGAVGDGTTVNTTAIQAAITAAAAIGGAVYIPPGLYLTGPLTIPGTATALTIYGDAADLIMESAHTPTTTGGAILKLANSSNSTLLTVAVGAGPVYLRDLWLHGNQAGQASGTSFGVDFPTDGVSSYGRAGKLERVRIERCRSGAVNVGNNRNAGDIVDCTFQLCGFNSDGTPVASNGDGILIGSSNDWRIDTLDCGAHTRNGIYATGGQNLVMYSSMFYSNGARGIRMDATAGSLRAIGCMCDRNVGDGVLLLGVGSATKSVPRTLLNCHFSANNFSGTTGVFSDIRIDDSPITSDPVQIIGCSFTDSTATVNEVKYHVEARTTTTGVLLLAPMYRTDAAKAYATGALNDRTLIDEIDGPVSRNAFRVATSLSDINWVKISGGVSGTPQVVIGADGSGTNIPIQIAPKGSSPVYLRSTAPRLLMVNTSGATNETRAYQDLNGALLRFSLMSDDEASATRWMEVGRSGITVSYIALGGALSAETLRVTPVASQVNRVEVTGAVTTAAPAISVGGSDSNINLKLTPKGTGRVQFGTLTASADAAVSGYIEVLDSSGTVRKLAVIT